MAADKHLSPIQFGQVDTDQEHDGLDGPLGSYGDPNGGIFGWNGAGARIGIGAV